MLKISREPDANGLVTLRLEGEMTGPWVDETQRACEKVLAQGRRVRMDLRDIRFVDRAGVELLRRLEKGRAVLEHCSLFLKAQLRATGRHRGNGGTRSDYNLPARRGR